LLALKTIAMGTILLVKTRQLIINMNKIVWHWTSIGTYREAGGRARGTGEEVEIAGGRICRVVQGKISEEWAIWDNAAVFRQLGYTVVPPVPASKK